MEQSLKVIAKIYTAHKEKFGIPRQSGMVSLPAEIVFEPQYRDPNAVRGLDGFSHTLSFRHGYAVPPPSSEGGTIVEIIFSEMAL